MKQRLNKLKLTVAQRKLSALLDNWTYFAIKLPKEMLSEEDFLALIKLEVESHNRWYMIKRLYGKYSTLRKERELKELEELGR